jgi:uncharacterized protein involved in oxidation of intracellular sulfur
VRVSIPRTAGPSGGLIRVNVLFVLNDPPYGTERTYNGLRHANALAQRDDVHVRVFLMADATAAARRGQKTPNGYYNLERMLAVARRRGTEIGACGSCLDARGLAEAGLAEGVHRSSMDELTDWTLWSDRVIVY